MILDTNKLQHLVCLIQYKEEVNTSKDYFGLDRSLYCIHRYLKQRSKMSSKDICNYSIMSLYYFLCISKYYWCRVPFQKQWCLDKHQHKLLHTKLSRRSHSSTCNSEQVQNYHMSRTQLLDMRKDHCSFLLNKLCLIGYCTRQQ